MGGAVFVKIFGGGGGKQLEIMAGLQGSTPFQSSHDHRFRSHWIPNLWPTVWIMTIHYVSPRHKLYWAQACRASAEQDYLFHMLLSSCLRIMCLACTRNTLHEQCILLLSTLHKLGKSGVEKCHKHLGTSEKMSCEKSNRPTMVRLWLRLILCVVVSHSNSLFSLFMHILLLFPISESLML